MTNDHNIRVYDSVLGLLSSEENPTPLVRLNKVVPFKHTQVFAKLEWYNPFGAVKDRVAVNMIRDAEERNELGPGKNLIEATSGNTGVGLAMIGNAKGYALRTPLSKAIPLEKRTVLRFMGCDVIEMNDMLCPAPGAPEGAIALARNAAETEKDTVLLDQYANEANPDSHFRTTGPEIWKQTAGKVTHFVAGLGTCGTITGTGRFLKSKNSDIKVLGVHPEDGHDIPGVRSITQLQQTKLFHPEEYDGTTETADRDAFELCLKLNQEESIIAGPSSGMALAGALQMIPDEPGNIVVVIFPDNIFKYASSMQRHFPELCPADETEDGNAGPSENDVFLADMMENLKNKHDSVRVKEVFGQLEEESRPMIIDVRPKDMFEESHVPHAVNIPQSELAERKGELPEDREAAIVMVCGIGKFSKPTTLYLKSLGYRNVRSMKGGINEWVRKEYPTESSPSGSTE
jgi:cysteine synthase/rhodanese-related sulfurtransferase